MTHRGLMYVELLTGGQKIVALVDSGVTDELKSHPFLVHFSDLFLSKKD